MTKQHITLTAISGIILLEAIALFQGIDGTVFSLVIAALAGLGGYELRSAKIEKLKNN